MSRHKYGMFNDYTSALKYLNGKNAKKIPSIKETWLYKLDDRIQLTHWSTDIASYFP